MPDLLVLRSYRHSVSSTIYYLLTTTMPHLIPNTILPPQCLIYYLLRSYHHFNRVAHLCFYRRLQLGALHTKQNEFVELQLTGHILFIRTPPAPLKNGVIVLLRACRPGAI